MNVALLTYNLGQNYGGILQAYALFNTLKNSGCKPELLYLRTESEKTWKWYLKINFLSKFTRKYNKLLHEEYIYQELHEFVKREFVPRTKQLKENDFYNLPTEKYDAFIVGSDQVWRARMFKYIEFAFFSFVNDTNAKLISYAPSFGVDTWDYSEDETKRFSEQISKFKAISVREVSGIKLCEENLGRSPVHVLDPTLLLSKDDYIGLIDNTVTTHEGVLTYILDETDDKSILINEVSDSLSLPTFKVGAKKNMSTNIEEMKYPPVESWLAGFKNANFIITDSFHGCVFSVIFNKPFIVYGNQKRGMARFQSFLELLGLEDRLVTSFSEAKESLWTESIDWTMVNNRLGAQRENSLKYLSDSLFD